MSVVPFTTQLVAQNPTQCHTQQEVTFVLVHYNGMTEHHSKLMTRCQDLLRTKGMPVATKQKDELWTLPLNTRFFVIPTRDKDLINLLRDHFKNVRLSIYLPRAVFEALGTFNVQLPARRLGVSLTMYGCKIFLVQDCNLPDLRDKINEMSGQIMKNFKECDPNIVITNRADNKYCTKAFKKGVFVVSRKWVDYNYNNAVKDDLISSERKTKSEAMENLKDFKIKPFFGLHFVIEKSCSDPAVTKLITTNQGHVIYATDRNRLEGATHKVLSSTENISEEKDGPKIVDTDFLRLCQESGYYVLEREPKKLRSSSVTVVKEEPKSQVTSQLGENNTPPSNSFICKEESQINMLSPPQAPRPLRQQQPDNIMNEMIRRAMLTFENAQTQQASTQMRRLPDPELRIEQTYEPSQQLYWTDRRSR